jgi:hypothetical protein
MSHMTSVKARLREQAASYSDGADRPLAGYAGTMGVYAAVVGLTALVTRLTNREVPGTLSPADVALSAAATHKLSRLLAKDPVTSPLRAPFTSYEGTSAPSELHEEVRGQGARKAIGELVTCPFCTGVWVATGFTAGMIYLPRTTRLAMGTLAALTGADMLQYAYAWLQQNAS